jgi:6-phosphogluconolactonase
VAAAVVSVIVSDDLVADATARIESLLARGGTIALAGGSTPRPVYARLSLPWDRIEVFLGDERDHEETNWKLARETILDRTGVRAHRMEAERGVEGARAYAALLPDAFDLIVLGMGDDLHTASLFPGEAALASTERVAWVPMSPTSPKCPRLTITPPVIAAAREILVLVAGASKAAPLVTALRGEFDPVRYPIQLARRGTFLVDRAAGAHL